MITLPEQPWEKDDTFTVEETGLVYTYDGEKWLAAGGEEFDGDLYATKAFVDEIESASIFRDEAIKADLEDKDKKQTAAILVVEGDVQNEAKNRKIGDDRLQEQIDALNVPDGVDLGPVEDRLDAIEEVLPTVPPVIDPVDIGEQICEITGSRPTGGSGKAGSVLMWKAEIGGPAAPYNEAKLVIPDNSVIQVGANPIWWKQGDRVQRWDMNGNGWFTNGNVLHLNCSTSSGDDFVDGEPIELYYIDPNAKGDDLIEVISRMESKADDRKLQAEIEVLSGQLSTLVKSQEDGEWRFIGSINVNVPRNAGDFALLTDQLTSQDNGVVLREEDLNGITHNFNAPVGSYIEIVDEEDPLDYVLFEVTKEPDGTGLVQIDTKLVKAGNNFEIGDRCIIRFFEIGEGLDINELDSRYLQLSGGVMKGDLYFDGPRQISYIDDNGQSWVQFRLGATTEYLGQYGASEFAIATRKRVEDAVEGLASEEWVTGQLEAIDVPDTDLTGYATEQYVDQKVYQASFTPGQQVAKIGSSSNNTGAFWIIDGALYCKV